MRSPRFPEAGLVAGLACVFLIIATAQSSAQQPAAGAPQPDFGAQFGPVDPRVEVRSYLFQDTGEKLPYGLFVSSKVRKDRKAPLIVALHGLGAGFESMVRANFRTVELAEKGGYILVVPTGYNTSGWYGIPAGPPGAAPDPRRIREFSEQDVMNVLAMIRKEFTVDDSRIYLMGHSMGGAGTLYLGVKHASIWAALAPIAPAAFDLDPDSLAAIHDMPVIIVQGAMDTAVPVTYTRLWADKLKALRMNYQYLEIRDGDHMSVIGTGMPKIFAFFAAHPKTAH